MKKFILITLSTTVCILLADYIFNCIRLGEISQYIEITLRQISVISIFIGMIYFAIAYSSKGEFISYFLPVLIWYLISNTVLSFDVFSNVIVKLPNIIFNILIIFGVLIIYLLLHGNTMKKR